MKSSQEFDMSRILNTIYRRKDAASAVFLVIAALTVYLAVSLPDVYRSTTLVLITPQKLPSTYVASTVTQNIEQRVRTVAQQILGRTSLEKIVREFNLFPSAGSDAKIEERVEQMRKKINIEINKNDTFQLSYDAPSAQQAMQVTARLGALFVDENIRVREQQASGTTTFMNTEVERLRKELEEQESIVNLYKSQHRDDLPEQMDANLRSLEQMRRELESGMLRLTSLEERRGIIERQVAETAAAGTDDKSGIARSLLARAGIDVRMKELELLRSRYSDKHPDVVRLMREITTTPPEGKDIPVDGKSSLAQMVGKQGDTLTSEINLLRERNKKLQSEIATYQDRVNNTPIRSIELKKITRNYDITLRKFQELLSKEFDSQLSENMEKTQKGEQFQVVDPARIPESPVAPNRMRMVLVGLLFGLAGAFGTAMLIEGLDGSIKGRDDLEGVADLSLVAVLPVVPTRGNLLELRQARMMLALYSAGVLTVGLVLIRLFGSLLPLR